MVKRFLISHNLFLELAQILIYSTPNQPMVGSPVEREQRLVVRGIHHISTPLSTTDTHKGIFVVFIVGAIEAKQTSIRLAT
jgi:hypothetical protein